MELKDRLSKTTDDGNQCFNRTFMELKVSLGQLFDYIATFQSHLYGIESGSHHGADMAVFDGFNRTFMELKVITILN